MAPLSLGLLSPGWPPESFTNGVVTYVATVAPALRDLGHEVAILAASAAPGPLDAGVYDAARIVRDRAFPRRLADGLWFRFDRQGCIRGLARRGIVETARLAAREHRVQVFDLEESFGWAGAVQREVGLPVCVRLHGPYFLTGPASGAPEDEVFRERVAAEGAAIRAAACVSAPAADVLDKVREHYGLELASAEVIPNPVAHVPRSERWQLSACDRERIVFVGRFDRLKGADLLIDAFSRILREWPRARLTLVGPDGTCTTDDGRAWNLEGLVRDRLPGSLESGRVEWVGRQPAAALPALRRKALVTVVCSRYENFPYAVTEAMALGCPLVAARVAGIPEVVRDQHNGLLHRAGDAGDLAARILDLLRAPERAAALGAQAGADAERTLRPDAIARRLQDVYLRAREWRPGVKAR